MADVADWQLEGEINGSEKLGDEDFETGEGADEVGCAAEGVSACYNGTKGRRETYPAATNNEFPNGIFADARAQYAPASTMKPICKLRKTMTNMMFVRSEQIR